MEFDLSIAILLIGTTVVMAILTKYGFRLLSLPAITGYFLLGIILNLAGDRLHLFSDFSKQIFYFLSNLGIIVLLFRIGLESKLIDLIRWLPKAAIVWTGDVMISGLLGFWVSYELLSLDLIPSLFIATAFTATSVGISVAVWEELKVLHTSEGQVLLDTAELDDISAILLMGILFSVVPILREQTEGAEIMWTVIETVGIYLVKMVVFGIGCLLVARYVQQPLTDFLNRLHSGDSEMLVVLGMGLIVASIASLIGFSVAVGAFFAGLIFSNNPDVVRIDASFESIYELFIPFFYVGIGLALDLSVISGAFGPALILLATAIVSKFFGAGTPSFFTLGKNAGLLIGLSMIPRAEIALIVMQRGLALGEWAVNASVFAYFVIISFTTTLIIPLSLRPLIQYKSPKLRRI